MWGPRRDDTQREERGGQLGPPRSCWRCPALLVMEAGGDLAGACRCFPKQREGGLGIHGVAMRQPRCTGSAAGFQTTESRARKVPGHQQGPRVDVGGACLLQGHSLSQPWGQAWSGG